MPRGNRRAYSVQASPTHAGIRVPTAAMVNCMWLQADWLLPLRCLLLASHSFSRL